MNLYWGDNTCIAELDVARLTFLYHSVLYFIATKDEKLNAAMFNNVQNLINKSTMISKIGEKERVEFFNKLRVKIDRKSKLLY